MFIPPQMIQIGPLMITVHGIIVAIAVFAGYIIAKRRAHLYNMSIDDLERALTYAFVFSIVGGRLYHVIDNLSYYSQFPLEIFAVWRGGMAIYGSLIGGFVSLYLYAKKHKIPLLSFLDLVAPSVLLGQAIGRWGNYFNQENFGPPTNLPWKLFIDESHRPVQWQNQQFFHPLFLYESLWTFVGFLLLISFAKCLRRWNGAAAALYLIIYGVGRLWIEQLRFDTAVIAGIKVATLLSLAFIALGVSILYWRFSHQEKVARKVSRLR